MPETRHPFCPKAFGRVFPINSLPACQLTEAGIDAIVSDAALKFEVCRRYYERVDSDVLFFFSDIAIQAEAMGAAVHMSADAMPSVSEPARTIRMPLPADCPRMQVNARTIARLKAHFPQKSVSTLVYGPFTVAGQLIGEQRLLKNTIQKPGEVRDVLEKTFAVAKNYLDAQLEAGADILWVSDPLAALLPPDRFRAFAGHYLAELFSRYSPIPSIIHICGDISGLLPRIVDTGVTGISFDQCMDLLLAEAVLPPEVCMLGNFDPDEGVAQSGLADITAGIYDLAHRMAGRLNYVMSTGCALPPSTPVENAAAFVDAGRNASKAVRPYTENLAVLSESVFNGNGRQTAACIEQALVGQVPPSPLIDGGLMRGMRKVSAWYEGKKRFLPDVLLATEAFYAGYKRLAPFLTSRGKQRPDIVLGTVRGDFHEIGKDLVRIMLEISGYSVLDLGVDVSPEAFIHAAETHGAPIIGLSVFITSARGQLRALLDIHRGLRPPRPKVIIGGAAASRGIAADIGADGFAGNAVEAARLVGRLLFRPAAAPDKAEG